MSDITHSSGRIVGCRLNKISYSAGTVSLIYNFFETLAATKLPGTFFYSPFNVFFGHVVGFGVGNSETETRIACWISAAITGRNGKLPDDPAENFRPGGIGSRLFVLDICPF